MASTGDLDLDVVALLQAQHVDHVGGETHCETIAPFRDLHAANFLRWIYVDYCISTSAHTSTSMASPRSSISSRRDAASPLPISLVSDSVVAAKSSRP